MSSPGQKRGSCGHAMAIFDGHAFCARCREKGKGEEPCVKDKDSVDCSLCNSFTPEQRAQISTPSYKIKKEKREAKHADICQPTDELIDPSSVSVIGVVGGPSTDKSPAPPEKKTKKDKPSVKPKKSATATLSSATDDKFTALEDKWSDRFNRLEAEEGDFSEDPEFEQELPTSEEQTYRETMRGIRSFMGWSHIPDMDSSNPSDDNPFAGPKAPLPSKVSVQMPTEDYLCRKLSKLNLTMTEGYPSRTTEAGSLQWTTFSDPPSRKQSGMDYILINNWTQLLSPVGIQARLN